MKYLRTFWKFILAAWRLEGGDGCLARIKLASLTEKRGTIGKSNDDPLCKKCNKQLIRCESTGIYICPTSDCEYVISIVRHPSSEISEVSLVVGGETIKSWVPSEIPKTVFVGEPKVLLHEAENCPECGKTFFSLYSLKKCKDHEGMEKL